jgi:GT2 family glycosyltransferase
MDVDAIILSNTDDLKYYGLLQRTINTLAWSEQNHKFNIIVVESNSNYLDKGFICPNANSVITPNQKFNYNKFLNIGLKECKNNWIIIANNDLIFTKNWFTKILNFEQKYNHYDSFSPFEPNWRPHKSLTIQEYYEGYRTAYEIAGWCLVLKRNVLETCGLFDESFEFWYQDNDYAMTLKKHNLKHALVRDSRVYHETSQSHKLLGDKEYEMTHNQQQTFLKKWK